MEQFYFRKLDVYQKSKTLVAYISQLLKKFPSDERFALCSQIRRASTSIPINIAEGFGRFSAKEKVRFIEIAFGSLTEVICELELSLEQGYISQDEFENAEHQLIVISKQLSALRLSVLNNGDFNPQANNP